MPDNEQLAISNNEEPVVPNNLESPAVSNNKLSLSPAKEATQKVSGCGLAKKKTFVEIRITWCEARRLQIIR